MSALAANAKQLTFELVVAESRDNVDVITEIAHALDVAIGEQTEFEYVQLKHVKHIKELQKEALNATAGI